MSVKIEVDDDGPYFLIGDKSDVKIRPELSERFKIGGRADLLARSIGYRKNTKLRVLDLTAGLCRDSYHFACLGCEVVALERHPDIYFVVKHYVQSLPTHLKLDLIRAEAKDYLSRLKDLPDVIYFDPMFPEKKKSAKSGKETELLKLLAPISPDSDERDILQLARSKALSRVVVKRPLTAPPIGGIKPSTQFVGKAVRYDVYLVYRAATEAV